MTKSDPYAELFHAMAKVPVIPAGLTQIGSDVGRVVDRAPPEQPHAMSCGDVGNVMPEVAKPTYSFVSCGQAIDALNYTITHNGKEYEKARKAIEYLAAFIVAQHNDPERPQE